MVMATWMPLHSEQLVLRLPRTLRTYRPRIPSILGPRKCQRLTLCQHKAAVSLAGATWPVPLQPSLQHATHRSKGKAAQASNNETATLKQKAPSKTYNVVITGSTKGVGRALAQRFLEAGDNVCISSRSPERVRETLSALSSVAASGGGSVKGIAADVAKAADVTKLAQYAVNTFGSVDLWINNAGSNGYKYTPLAESDVNDLINIVTTNTLGTMLCCREAIQVMAQQPSGGHIFNMDGAGADGNPTPKFAAYGSTKRGLAQFSKSLAAEIKQQSLGNVVVHNLSPGMVNTELLMSGSTSSKVAKFFINCLAEEPADVAALLVPKIREVPLQKKSRYIRALTKPAAYARIIDRLVTGNRKNRYLQE